MSTIEILIAYAEPRQQREVVVEVPLGITLQEALALLATQIGVLLNGEPMGAIGVWGGKSAHRITFCVMVTGLNAIDR